MSQPGTGSKGRGQAKPESHPLLIGEIADKIFGYLDQPRDLESCFDTCKVWRDLVPAHNIRIRSTRYPVLIKGDMSDERTHSAYLASIRKHPSFKATKFCFRNVMLRSPAIRKFLEEHGEEMEELELWHGDEERKQEKKFRFSHKINLPSPLTKQDLEELFRDKLPNLKTLIFKIVPIILGGDSADLFQINSTPTSSTPVASTSASAVSADQQPGPKGFMKLPLKKIAITTAWMWRSVFDPSHPMSSLLVSFFAASPQLEEFELIEWKSRVDILGFDVARHLAESTMSALMITERLHQMRVLKFSIADKNVFPRLAGNLAPNQLTTLRIGEVKYDGPMFGPSMETLNANSIQDIFNNQAGSLEHLELPLFRVEPLGLTLPPMLNLVELHLSRDDLNEDWAIFPLPLAHGHGTLNYANFPHLRVLGLNGLLKNYLADEIFPDPVNQFNSSVKVLHAIPLGVDQELMSRIGRLFPNLRKINTHISFEQEILLVSIWEFCPHITDLFLAFDTDDDNYPDPIDTSRGNRCLDSIFSGIPNSVCRRLSELWPQELELKKELIRLRRLWVYGAEPSIRDLKQLKRLCIHGPSTTVRGQPKPSHPDRRSDQLSNVFGYATLRFLDLVFFQIREALTEMTPYCVHEVCEEARLELVTPGSSGFDPKSVRLIKPGIGLERLGRGPPAEWRLRTDGV